MKRLALPAVIPFTEFQGVVRGKDEPRRSRLIALEDDVRVRFEVFDKAHADLTEITPLVHPEQVKEDLKHCYEPNVARDQILTAIEAAQPAHLQRFCFFCGINNTGIWDHYLPQAHYPEYAIHAYNLMHSCDDCNKRKSDSIKNEENIRLFVNFYFDTLPAVPILKAEIDWATTTPRATYRFIEEHLTNHPLGQTIRAHFKRLNLLARFGQEAHKEFAKLLIAMQCTDDRLDLLQFEARRWSATYSANNWQAVFYDTVSSEYEQCLNWIEACLREGPI